MLAEILAAGHLTFRWVTADEHFGENPAPFDGIAAAGQWYQVEVSKDTRSTICSQAEVVRGTGWRLRRLFNNKSGPHNGPGALACGPRHRAAQRPSMRSWRPDPLSPAAPSGRLPLTPQAHALRLGIRPTNHKNVT